MAAARASGPGIGRRTARLLHAWVSPLPRGDRREEHAHQRDDNASRDPAPAPTIYVQILAAPTTMLPNVTGCYGFGLSSNATVTRASPRRQGSTHTYSRMRPATRSIGLGGSPSSYASVDVMLATAISNAPMPARMA